MFYGVFKLMLLFFIPIIGVFYRNRLTWKILLTYFYFLLWHVCSVPFFLVGSEFFMNVKAVLIIIAMLIIPGLSIYILNRPGTFNTIYSVEKKPLNLYNLISF